MRRSEVVLTALFGLLVAALGGAASAQPLPAPPHARRAPWVTSHHGERWTDEYHWLQRKGAPDVDAYLRAENRYTDAFMKPSEPLQAKLYAEMVARLQGTDVGVPYRRGGYLYYERTEAGKQYPIHCRKRSAESPEEVVLDLNVVGAGERFVETEAFEISDDGNWLAYGIDFSGYRDYTLRIRDLRTGQDLGGRAERVARVDSVAWAADNRTLFYVVQDAAKRPARLYRHQLGAAGPDPLVYEEKDERFELDVSRTRSGRFLIAASHSYTSSEARYLDAATPAAAWTLYAARLPDRQYVLDHRGDEFFLLTNASGPNFSIVAAPVADPHPARYRDILPHSDAIMREHFYLFANHVVSFEREDGLPQLRVTDLKTLASHTISFPEPAYSVDLDQNHDFDTATLRFNYTSFVTPLSTFDYDMVKRERTLLKRAVVPGYQPTDYTEERVHARAADGTDVPVSLVYKRGLSRDGKNPMLLQGYGAYGYTYSSDFDGNYVSLFDRGVIYAFAHIRGGGERGQRWHDGGRMLAKRNSFTDFIACAEHLIAQGYTSRERLVIKGVSAGGLLVGAVTNLRPDLFRAVIARVPFVDVINTMFDQSLPLTVGEFDEWGDPRDPAQYAYMKSYSPYDNIGAGPYPAMLVRTAINDSLVMYWEPTKWVARMRARRPKDDKRPLLLRINMKPAGHEGSSGRYDQMRELAFDWAFLLNQVGITE